jgi:hypothetical protein
MQNKLKKRKNPLYLFMHVPKCGGSTFVKHLQNNFKQEEIINLYPIQEVYHKVAGCKIPRDPSDIKNYFQLLEDMKKDNIKAIYGHNVFYGIHEYFSKPCRYVTFLRHPTARILSDYNMGLYLFDLFKKGLINDDQRRTLNRRYFIDSSEKMRPFEEWIDSVRTGANHTIFFLHARSSLDKQIIETVTREHLEIAKKLLEKFYFVCITENFDEDAAFLYGKLQIRQFCENHNVAPKYYLQKDDKKMIDLIISKTQLDTELYEHAKKLNREFKKRNKHFYFLTTLMKWKRSLSDRLGKTIKDS